MGVDGMLAVGVHTNQKGRKRLATFALAATLQAHASSSGDPLGAPDYGDPDRELLLRAVVDIRSVMEGQCFFRMNMGT